MEARRKIWLLVLIDYAFGLVSTYLTFLATKAPFSTPALFLIPLVVVVVAYLFRLYRVIYRHLDFIDIWKMAWAVLLSHVITYVVFKNLGIRFAFTSLAVFLCALCGSRVAFKIWTSKRIKDKHPSHQQKLRTVIIGAGQAGILVSAEIEKHTDLRADVISFVDDDLTKLGRTIHNIPVLGTIDDLERIIGQYRIEQVIFAIPSSSGALVRKVNSVVKKYKVKFKILPGVFEILDGSVQVSTVRDVSIDDLLRREPIKIDIDTISSDLTGKVVLVTGAAGSIGSELVRQICKFKPKEIVLLDINENGLHDMHLELKNKHPEQAHRCVVANIREQKRIDELFEEIRPSIVFHAAAHKHVPMMEYNPGEAIKNNVFGTLNVALAASKYNAKRFVLISTDKAVNPTNVMGATKRTAEKIIQSLGQKSSTIFTAVRFGNVLGSNGSVVPIFKQQIASGGPVTVTHPDIKRYFMTIPEACQLVLQAGINAEQGEVYILDMGEPVKIVDLAKAMIELSGYTVGEDIEIKFVGLRPGEKLFEELFADTESSSPTSHNKVMRAHLGKVDGDTLLRQLEELEEVAKSGDHVAMRQALQKIVPNYSVDYDKVLEEIAATRNY